MQDEGHFPRGDPKQAMKTRGKLSTKDKKPNTQEQETRYVRALHVVQKDKVANDALQRGRLQGSKPHIRAHRVEPSLLISQRYLVSVPAFSNEKIKHVVRVEWFLGLLLE